MRLQVSLAKMFLNKILVFFLYVLVLLPFRPVFAENILLDSSFGYDATQINYQDNSASAVNSSNPFESALAKSAKKMGYVVGADPTLNITVKIATYLSVILSFLGVVFLVLTIYAGYIWMTAQGAQADVDKAKKILAAAVIGFAIIASAYAITRLASEIATPQSALVVDP